MHPAFMKTFGGLAPQYYFRNLLFGGVVAGLFFYLQTRDGGAFGPGLAVFWVVSTLLYPYSRFVYESVVEFLVGDNFFLVNALILLAAKALTIFLCWLFAVFIAPLGLVWLYFYHSRRSCLPAAAADFVDDVPANGPACPHVDIDDDEPVSATVLDVPYAEKDEAKALGARWDPEIRKWYVPAGVETAPFRGWLPAAPAMVYAIGILYVVEASEPCWRCGEPAPVYCLASDYYSYAGEEDDFITYSNLRAPPGSVRRALAARYPSYREDYSKTAGERYYMNHCRCGASLGDFFLHHEPGGAFCPANREHLNGVRLSALFDEPVYLALQAAPCISSPNYLKELA